MVIDTSALIAILDDEPEREHFVALVATAGTTTTAATSFCSRARTLRRPMWPRWYERRADTRTHGQRFGYDLSSTMLSEQELIHFRTFGFVVLRQLFTAEEVETLRGEYELELDRVYQDQPFDGSERHWTMMLGDTTPLFATLLEGPRFCEVAEQMYGDDVIGIGCDANRYVGHSRWHPDH
tara:strand:- start:103 stop:645 length:543 start_codon:yes stop_codon:yes gene_type:complete